MARRIAPDAQEAMATAKFIRMSPTKVRRVVDLIRGRHVEDARRILRFTPRAASPTVAKVLDSAVANAEHNRGLTADELVVMRSWVDEGPTLRRFRPRALGRATRINKRMCHVSVVVGRPPDEPPVVERRTRKKTARRVRKDTTGSPQESAAATGASPATQAAPKKTTRKKTTKKKTTREKTTKKKES